MKIREILWLLLITIFSVTLGTIYSVHNTDPHHWGFISGTVLDYIKGKHFFSELYIQYGIGEPLLFKFLGYFVPINYTSLGILTSLAYAGTLSILYLSIRKLSNANVAMLAMSIIFLLHPYCIYPWSDYWAGLSLGIACFFLLKNSVKHSIIAGAFLFCAFLFRNTYVMSITAAMLSYGVLTLLNSKLKNRNLLVTAGTFFLFMGIYFAWLIQENTLQLWFQQTLQAGSSQYGVGLTTVLPLLKRVFLPAKFYLPNNQVVVTISVLFYLSFYALYLFVFKSKENEAKQNLGTTTFLTLLGLAGIAQAMLGYEMFRIQNACSPLYLVFVSLLLIKFPDLELQLKKKKVLIPLGVYLLLLIAKFPHSSSLFPLYDGAWSEYTESKNPYFRWHRFRAEEQKYYEDLEKFVCDGKRKILNRTMDSTIAYLCPNQENAVGLPFLNRDFLISINRKQVQADLNGDYQEDQVIITDGTLATHPGVKLVPVGIVQYPLKFRYFGQVPVTVYHVERAAPSVQ